MKLARQSYLLISLATALALGGCHSKSSPEANNQTPSSQTAGSPSQTPQTGPQQSGGGAPAQSGGMASAPAPAPAPPPPPPAVVRLPTGTRIRVRLDQDLSSNGNQPGDTFTATVANDVMVNGTTVIPQGSRADGTVVDAKALGHFKGGALLAVRLDRVHTRWGSYPVETGTIDKVEKGKGKRSAAFIGGGAGLGALIGGLAGGGKGALIGALAGGGAGTAGSAFTGNKQIVIPAEALLTFRLQQSVQITEERRVSGSNPQLQQR